MLGQKFGRWTVKELSGKTGNNWYYICSCDCGKEKRICKGNLTSGKTKSCGCLNAEVLSARSTTHGQSSQPIYAVWNMMKQRCQVSTNRDYPNYGGRGIKVCKDWQDFEKFALDMGEPPKKGMSLERLDNNLGYDKGNVVWADRTTQNNHQRKSVRYTYRNESLTLKEISEKYSINLNTLTNRIYKYGMLISEAIEKPIMHPAFSGALAGKPVFEVTGKRIDGFNPFKDME